MYTFKIKDASGKVLTEFSPHLKQKFIVGLDGQLTIVSGRGKNYKSITLGKYATFGRADEIFYDIQAALNRYFLIDGAPDEFILPNN